MNILLPSHPITLLSSSFFVVVPYYRTWYRCSRYERTIYELRNKNIIIIYYLLYYFFIYKKIE